MKHELKIWPKYYCRVRSGEKTFEVRDNDRDFQRGDIVVLNEYDPEIPEKRSPGMPEGPIGYTGSEPLEFKIGYVLPIDDKRVVFSLIDKGE